VWEALALVLAHGPGTPSTPPAGLLGAARQVECGNDRDAELALTTLERAPKPLGLPDESLGVAAPQLRASMLDVALSLLDAAARDRPALRQRIERMVGTWQLCHQTSAGRWDLELVDGVIVRTTPVDLSPLLSASLGARDPEAQTARPAAPNPVTCDATWDALARYLPPTPSGPLRVGLREASPCSFSTLKPARSTWVPRLTPIELPRSGLAALLPVAPAPTLTNHPSAGAEGGVVTPIAVGSAQGGVAVTVAPSVSFKLTGGFSAATGVSAGWKGFFVRAGVSYAFVEKWQFEPERHLPTLSWGLGYDDWHPGTFSLQLNNWGGIRPEKPLDYITGVSADLAYKVPFPAWLGRFLSVSPKLSYTIFVRPSAAVTVTLTPLKGLFISMSVRYGPWDPTPFTWAYTFGFAFSKPFDWRIAYANWGPNPIPSLNFVQNGSVSLQLALPLLK
jgi:hypothetical protein